MSSNTEQYELIKKLHAALKDLVHQIPNDEGLADWRLDFAESADLKADQFFKDNPNPPSPSPEGVEEAAVKSAEEEAMRRFPIIAEEYFDDTWRTYDEYEKEQLKFRDLFVTASKWQASRSKGVGMQWVKASDRLPSKSGLFCIKDFREGRDGILATSTYTTQAGSGKPSLFTSHPDKIYWLDESAPLSDNSQAEGRERVTVDQLKEAYRAGIVIRGYEWPNLTIEELVEKHFKNFLSSISTSSSSEGKEEKGLEERTEANMNLISSFVEHLKEQDISLPESSVLSFFNA